MFRLVVIGYLDVRPSMLRMMYASLHSTRYLPQRLRNTVQLMRVCCIRIQYSMAGLVLNAGQWKGF